MKSLSSIRRALRGAYGEVFHRYPVLGAIAGIAILGQIGTASINSLSLPFYELGSLKLPGRVLGYTASAFLAAETLLKLPFGYMSDHYGRRPFVMAGLLAVTATPLAILLVPSAALPAAVLLYAVMLPLRLVGGAGSAATWPPLFAAVPDSVPKQDRGTGMAIINSAYVAGLALGPALAGADN